MDFENLEEISLEEIRRIELNILIEFDRFCNEHGLKYVLDGGTLIGAIRHKGFIPWDDDIDVVMPFPDFLKFVELYRKESVDKPIKLLYGLDDSCGFHYGKLVDRRTIVKSSFRQDKSLYSVWIDIFPMYSMDDDDDLAQAKIDKILHYYEKTWACMCVNYRNPVRKLCHLLFNDRMLKHYMKKINGIMSEHAYGSTKRIRFAPVVSRKLCPAQNDHFDNRIKLEFAGYEFYAPKDYDAYLTGMYGDYMKLPPEEQRINHKIEAYWAK